MKLKIYIGANRGLPNIGRSLQAISDRLSSSVLAKENIQIVDSPASEFEYPALRRLWLDSHTEQFYGLYLHCKGASKATGKDLENGLAWLDYMLYGLIDHSTACLEHMSRGADLVGSMWYRHFKGNCFWFKSSYVKKLGDPYSLDTGNRYHAEYWCSQAYWGNKSLALPKVKNLFYLPLKTDDDFLELRQNGHRPDLYTRNACTDLCAAVESKDYTIYNDLQLSREDLKDLSDQIERYTNYDSTITIV